MESPNYKLERLDFDGPLDVLLSLIEKHKLDIRDLPIAHLLEQYLAFIRECEEQNWDLTADFIEMIARLTYIKSYSLLPPSENTEEEEDPKQELERMLQEYARYKQLAGELRSDYIGDRIWFREGNDETLPKPPSDFRFIPDKLQNAYRRVLIKYAAMQPDPGRLGTLINTTYVPITACVSRLTERFRETPRMEFEKIFDACRSRSEIIATFLAILELLRCGRLDMTAEDEKVELFVIDDTEGE